jgi:hypothetical protein
MQIFLKGRKSVYLIVNFGQFPCSWIRIRISTRFQDNQINADPDPQHGAYTNIRYSLQGVVQNPKVLFFPIKQMVRTAIALDNQPGPVIQYCTCQLLGCKVAFCSDEQNSR